EIHNSIARAALFGDATIAPLAAPCVDVIALAKEDLQAGTVLDGLGGYLTYGVAENAAVVQRDALLPIGLAEGCTLKRDVPRDQPLRYDDVELPVGRLCEALRRERDSAVS